ncbi:MAG: 16S rRNA (cytidine(1402)-2'-O)-methyltransferase [Flavobacteriales bacterium]|nr:16S rRNA (cytidine(1402)-2'-O)-methyltransferase [Flavobacteriales bacterium]
MEKLIHIIPTPIGNLEDITLRAIRILKEVDLILAEDTRVTKKLLSHYNITNKMLSYHAFNEHKILNKIIDKIHAGIKIGVVSDAGTPGISDPGFLLIRECLHQGIEINCLPGPTACIPALIKAGLPCDRFIFEGFLPIKKGRKKRLTTISNEDRTIILYESPHRILKTLRELSQCCPQKNIIVLKELTKIHEKTYRGEINNIINDISKSRLKGEFIIVLNGEN